MKKVVIGLLVTIFSSFSILSIGVGAEEPKVKVIYSVDMKSEEQLLLDALEGRRDPGLQVQVFSDVVDKDGNILEDQQNNIKTYYTVQKLKEVQEGTKKTTSFVVVAVTDPTGYDKRDPRTNPGLNFRQTVWGWFDKIQDGIYEYGKGTRYEARWDLLDGNRLTIKKGTFVAKTEGDTMNRKPIFKSDPTTYTPPTWGLRYVKTPKWDYVLVSGEFGYAGASVVTEYKAGSTEATLYSNVYIGTVPLPGPFMQNDNFAQ